MLGSTPRKSANTTINRPPRPPPIAIPLPGPRPPPLVDVVLVSICMPSLNVIAPLHLLATRGWTQLCPALHTTIWVWQSLPDIPPSYTRGLGDLRGTTEGGVGVWRGVPYAEQPVGERRFLAPAPLQPWTGLRDALEHGPLPPQSKSFVGGGRDDPKVRDEACLSLTVWSPDTSGSLPVMVWIPGGAFVFGAGQFQLYNGSRLAANGNVVVVNITYRIGVFGGLELSDLGDGYDDNLALRDQMAALRWIREHIAAFGGDPDRVTVFGESAGATSVLALLASPAADGLFRRAIAQSPALPLIADRELRARRAHEFLQRLGVSVAEVKGLPQRQLRRAAGRLQLKSAAMTPTLAYGLTYGVDLLPNHPIDAARAGTLARVPLIIGTNSHEASMFAWTKPPMLPNDHGVDRFLPRPRRTRRQGPRACRLPGLPAQARARRVRL